MKTEPKPFASLSSGLLARKGAARPAMRPQGFGQLGANLEDLGWNDMGFEPPKPARTGQPDAEHDAFGEVIPSHPHNLAGLTPVESPVHGQQAEIAGRLSSFSPEDSGEDEYDETAELYDPDQDEAPNEVEAVEVVEAVEAVEEVFAVEAEAGEPVFVEEPAPVEADVEQADVEEPKLAPSPAARRFVKPRAAAGNKAKAAFTLRLDPERHLKLRLACAVDGRSAQMLVTEALDRLLESMPELGALAEKARKKG